MNFEGFRLYSQQFEVPYRGNGQFELNLQEGGRIGEPQFVPAIDTEKLPGEIYVREAFASGIVAVAFVHGDVGMAELAVNPAFVKIEGTELRKLGTLQMFTASMGRTNRILVNNCVDRLGEAESGSIYGVTAGAEWFNAQLKFVPNLR